MELPPSQRARPPRDYNAYHAAEQRLDNHYVGGLAVPGVEAPVVRTGPGYSGVQAVEDLYTSGLTGDLTPYQTEQRRQAMDRLKPYFYTVDAQHRDQVFAQWATPELCLVPGATAPPSYDPPDREKLIQQLVADGIPNGNPRPTWKQADAYVTAQTNDAVARLNSAGIAIDPGVAQRYMDQPMATDPHYPNRLEPLLHVNLPSDDHLVGAFEKAFGDNVGSIPSMLGVDGLSQMGQSWKDVGLATESVLSVAPVTSAWMGWLADANGGHLPGMSKPDQQYQIVGDMAAGLTGWNQFRHGDIQAGIGTAFGNLTGGIVAGAVTGAVTDGVAGTVIGAARAAAGAGILDSATADSAITAASQAITRTRNGLADAIQPDPYTLDHTRGPGHATPKPDDPDSIRQRIANAIRPDHEPDDEPTQRNPSLTDPAEPAEADTGDDDPDTPRLVTYTQDADGIWHAIDRDGKPHTLPDGVRPWTNKLGNVNWRNRQGHPVTMDDWAKKDSIVVHAPEYRGEPTPMGPYTKPVRDRLAGIDKQQKTEIADRKNIENQIKPIIDKMTIIGDDGNPRKVKISDLSDSKLKDTISELKDSRNYSTAQVNKVQALAEDLTDAKGSITNLSELRGQVGGDFYTQLEGLDTFYVGKGPYNPDRLAIRTLPDGTKRVVIIEEKGGDRPTLGTRVVDGLNAQQGSAAYGRNEFLRDDSEALKALQAKDKPLADALLAGDVDFEYVLVETAPGSNTITVTPFKPGPGQRFNLAHPTTNTAPAPPAATTPATVPTATADPIAGPGEPMWTNLITTSAPWLKDLTALGQHQTAAPVTQPLPIPFLNRQATTADQSLTVNISTRPTRLPAVTGENARVLTYGAPLLR